eukprot:343943-Karenia_brevis.AAC.1
MLYTGHSSSNGENVTGAPCTQMAAQEQNHGFAGSFSYEYKYGDCLHNAIDNAINLGAATNKTTNGPVTHRGR